MKNKPCILKKIGKIALIVLCSLLALVIVLLLGAHLFTPAVFSDFFKDAEKEFRIPGLSDGFVPQGFTYLPEEKLYIQCGYMTDGESASRIYLIPEGDEKNASFVELLTKDGAPYTGHTGGITTNGKLVWIANDGEGEDNCVWVFSFDELLAAKEGDGIKLTTSFQPESRAAYCYVDDEYLWVGEFYREGDYPTKESHAFEAAGGVEHHALICAYPLDSTAETGIKAGAPAHLLSVTGQVQGMVRTENGDFILSTSYGLSKSHLLVYKNPVGSPDDVDRPTLDIDGTPVTVWFLDEDNLIRDIVAPPMSEEMVVRNGRVYYLTESACHKYIFGNFIRGRHVYSLPIEK